MHDRLLQALYARGHRGVDLGLERVVRAARLLGDPQRALQVLHVAGTNGKGSTCAMLEAIALEAGLVTGLYTSPHLVRINDRVRVRGEPIGDDAFDEALGRVLRDAPADLTFFETLTLAAYVAFRDAKVDLAVLEVGLGGRLDATNLIESPLATGVVSIARGDEGRDLEHAALLGDTVEKIAKEKAGIAKRGAPMVVGPVDAAAERTIVEVARACGAEPIWTWGSLRIDAQSILELPSGARVHLAPRLGGAHQVENAAVAASMAALAARSVPSFTTAVIERGIESATWPGRMEWLGVRGRRVLLDCAHNVDGARALATACGDAGLDPSQTILVFGALADKAWRGMLRIIFPLASRRVYTLAEGRVPASIDDLRAVADGRSAPDPRIAVDQAIAQAEEGETVVVCGSIYLVGAVRAHLLGLQTDPVIAL